MAEFVQEKPALLTEADTDHLGAWLDDGRLAFARLYKKEPGHTARDFHRAVDGQGPTITIVEILAGQAYNYTTRRFDNQRQIVGGYNPRCWHSAGTWNFTLADECRNAFLFNLTTGEIQRQNLRGQGLNESGIYQTYNATEYGPIFGGGYDLCIDATLDYGEFYNYSFGATTSKKNILAGPDHHHSGYMIGELEVWGFKAS